MVDDTSQGQGHVATSLERFGRKLTYVVETELAEGINQVAVPSGDLVDPRSREARSVKFRAAQSGSGRLVLPEETRQRLFPGATEVVIVFGQE